MDSTLAMRQRGCTFPTTPVNNESNQVVDVVQIAYAPSFEATGWDEIQVTPAALRLLATDFGYVQNVTRWQREWNERPQALYHAGYAEGWVTYERIWAMYINTIEDQYLTNRTGTPAVGSQVIQWIGQHQQYIADTSAFWVTEQRRKFSMASVEAAFGDDAVPPVAGLADQWGAPNASSTFWLHVYSLMKQVSGLTDGYNAAVAASAGSTSLSGRAIPQPMNTTQMFWLSYQLEFEDIAVAVGLQQQSVESRPRHRKGHCSAIVKPTTTDLYFGHTTWFAYEYLLRQHKTYDFYPTVSFSGYAGVIHSNDDWYMTSAGLGVQETTNIIYNTALYATPSFTPQGRVSEFLRIMTANYASITGEDWCNTYLMWNSGTYNNQWMVVDMKRYQPPGGASLTLPIAASSLPDGTFWVLEQLPDLLNNPIDIGNQTGMRRSQFADVTSVLRTQGYWASYNIPYFPSVYEASGNAAMETQYGAYFSYTEYARPRMFQRWVEGNRSATQQQGSVMSSANMNDVQYILRYNDYLHDPMSLITNCDGEPNGVCSPPFSATLAISCRGDLDPANATGMGPLGNTTNAMVMQFGQQNLGAIDAKISSWSRMILPQLLPSADPTSPTSDWLQVNSSRFSNLPGLTPLHGAFICGPPVGGPSQLPPFNFSLPMFDRFSKISLLPSYNFDWIQVSTSNVPTATDDDVRLMQSKRIQAYAVGGAMLLVFLVGMAAKRCCHDDEDHYASTESEPFMSGTSA